MTAADTSMTRPSSKGWYIGAIVFCLSAIALVAWSLATAPPDHYVESLPVVGIGVILFNLTAGLVERKLAHPQAALIGQKYLSSVRAYFSAHKRERTSPIHQSDNFDLRRRSMMSLSWARKTANRFLGWLRITPAQGFLMVGALFASSLVYEAAGDAPIARHATAAVFLWLLAILWIIAGSWNSKTGDTTHQPKWTRLEVIVLVGLVILAFGLRYYDTGHIPYMLGGDEGAIGLASVPFATGQANNIFNTTLSTPSLYFFMQSLSIRIWGHTIEALRFSSVLGGTLAVLAIYWLARSMFGRAMAVLSAAYLAAFHFHIHFSRVALPNVWESLLSATVLACVWNGWTTGRRSVFIFLGLAAGFAQYFFPGVRLILMVIPVWLFIAFFKDRQRFLARLPDFVIALLVMLVVLLPLMAYYFQHPEVYTEPLARSFILSPSGPAHDHVFSSGASLGQVLVDQSTKTLLGFTYLPLTDWYTPGTPLLLALPGALFLIGLIYALCRVGQLSYSLLLLMLAFDLVFGEILTTNPPNAQRLLMAVPSVVVLLVLVVERFGHWLRQVDRRWAWPGYALAASIILVAMVVDINFYFNTYTPSKLFRDANDEIANDIANYLDTLGPGGQGWQVYCACPPRMGYYTHPLIEFLAPNAPGHEFIERLTTTPKVDPGQALFVFLPERRTELNLIEQSFPGGQVIDQYYRNGDLLFTFYKTVVP